MNYFTRIHYLAFVVLFILATSCHGQTKKGKPLTTAVKPQSSTVKKTKLVKTLGTNVYQNVHCIIQDKHGNIWLATSGEGVYRYDGKEFKQFTEKDGLSDNIVCSILEDRLGNIWFGTKNGVSRYNGKSISKVPINLISLGGLGTPVLQSHKNIVWSIMQDQTGLIWFGADDGIYCYNGKTYAYFLGKQNVINKSALTLKSMQCMFEDRDGIFWFGSGPMAFEGIVRYDGKSLTNFKPQNEGWIRAITEDKNGTLLFATRHIGMMTYNGKKFASFSQPQKMRMDLLNTVLVDSKGNIWYGSDYTNNNDVSTGGLWKFDGKSFIEFTKKDGLANTAVCGLKEDNAGNIWVGTRNCGLYRYNGQKFETFSE